MIYGACLLRLIYDLRDGVVTGENPYLKVYLTFFLLWFCTKVLVSLFLDSLHAKIPVGIQFVIKI